MKDQNFEILSVAVDLQGPDVVRPYAEGYDFTTVVDTENHLAGLFDFTVVPNGIFLDENGTIRLIKQGFSVNNEEHINAVEKLIRGEVDSVELEDVYAQPSQVSQLQKELAEAKFKLGMEYATQGRKEEALDQLDQALNYYPDNFLIRKQRWYIRYPEKFSPTIDFEWQKVQLANEQEEEAKARGEECGPEGCELPGSKPTSQ
jgi:tetratricopeptide (TPR) repeat protein